MNGNLSGVQVVQPRDVSLESLAPKTIKGMIDRFVNHIHTVESESESLSAVYGEWSWTKGRITKQ